MLPAPARDVLYGLLVVAALIAGEAAGLGARWVEWTAPTLRTALDHPGDLEVLSIGVARSAGQRVLRVRADLRHAVRIGRYTVEPLRTQPPLGGWMQVDVTPGGLLQHSALLLVLAVGWPAARARTRALRALVALGPATLLYLVTAVTTLRAEVWAPFHRSVIGIRDPWILDMSQYLMGGGGAVFGLVGAAMAVRLAAAMRGLGRSEVR